ncbi:Mannosyltransferase [Mycena indigotica]|uniref:Mannosyltransferase n=1 Tax=Mycena indigotica TaxID=2126181 RepID=A0A8H6SAH5_9AGAR|nr:Mannosyltransferase [Mycena indigotica]KAF7294762.1 Mannosyltransferase [Mycena indigotica]
MSLSSRVHVAIIIRVLIALVTATVFQPDEYYQSLEPAHHIVFGYGHLTWEWLNPRPIRSILYPALNIPLYWLLKATHLDEVGVFGDWLVINLPRLLHGTFAALTDIFLCSLTRRVLGQSYVPTALLVSLSSLFHALSLSRSLSNSLETSLTIIALSNYPWLIRPNVALDRSQLRKTLCSAALACAIRPTNAVIWVYLFAYMLWQLKGSWPASFIVAQDGILIGASTLVTVFLLDSWYYRHPTFTPWNFLATNLSNVSLFYGGNPWHYYISQAIPIMCTTSLPFALHTIWRIVNGKESRPLARSFHDLSQRKGFALNPQQLKILLLFTLPATCYIVLLYCSGPIEVMAFLRGLPRQELATGGVGFLMPCHSTPGQAYLHRPELADGKLWALGCEPPLQNQDLAAYRDQTTVFFESPYDYLAKRFPDMVDPTFPVSAFPRSIPGTRDAVDYAWVHAWPQHLVFFGALLEAQGVRSLLEARGYKEVWAAGRSWEGDSDERKGGVKVWKYASSS